MYYWMSNYITYILYTFVNSLKKELPGITKNTILRLDNISVIPTGGPRIFSGDPPVFF